MSAAFRVTQEWVNDKPHSYVYVALCNITRCAFSVFIILIFMGSDRVAGVVLMRWYGGIIAVVHSLGIVTSHLIIQQYHSHSGIILIGWR